MAGVRPLGISGALVLLLAAIPCARHAGTASLSPRSRTGVRSAALPLLFEPNQGQAQPGVRFLSRAPGFSFFISGTEMTVLLSEPPQPEGAVAGSPSGRAARPERGTQLLPAAKPRATPEVVRIALSGANPDPAMRGEEKQTGRVNYFLGNDPARWRTNIPTYKSVRCTEVYRGVDLVYYGSQSSRSEGTRLEYDFVVRPGADPDRIRLALSSGGAEPMDSRAPDVRIDSAGDLVVGTRRGELRQRKPVVYQEYAGGRRPVAAGYVLLAGAGGNPSAPEVGFRLGEYDRSRPLVIDPVLSAATYLGGSGNEDGEDIAVDEAGGIYLAGTTTSANFPVMNPVLGSSPGAGMDVFVTKLDPTGTSVVYSTYLGGRAEPAGDIDRAFGIAVDAAGCAYVTGYTDATTFPTTAGSFRSTRFPGGETAFLTKLSATGSSLVYSGYVAEFGRTHGESVALDPAGCAYVVGYTQSSSFPTTPGAFQTTHGSSGLHDAFVTKIAANGSSVVYSTLLGGGHNDLALDVAVDVLGQAHVTGWTSSTNFPRLNALQNAYTSASEVFITKLNAAGSGLIFSTYVGGTGGVDDHGRGIELDRAGNIYVAGNCLTPSFPVTPGAHDTTFNDWEDAFALSLTPMGALRYCTFIGGSAPDVANDIAVDPYGRAWITGTTSSTNYPTHLPLQGTKGAGYDAFVTRLNSDGSALISSTFFGGNGDDNFLSRFQGRLARNSAGKVCVIGTTASTTLTTVNASQGSSGGNRDAFVLVFDPVVPGAPGTLSATPAARDRVQLNWIAATGTVVGYEVERLQGGVFGLIGTVGGSTTAFEDSGLQPETAYTYRVRAVNNDGPSGYSNQASTTTLSGLPTAPANLVATAISPTRIDLAWTDRASDETGYRLERKLGPPAAPGDYGLIAELGMSVQSHSDTGVQQNTTYTYRVRAYNAFGSSAFADTASTTTPVDVPDAPSTLTATAVSDSRIDLTWKDNSAYETGFKVQRKLGSQEFSTITTVAAGVTAYSNTGLAEDTEYTYRVLATNSAGDSGPSNTATARTWLNPPSAPSDLVVGALTQTTALLEWRDRSSNEAGFEVERKSGSEDFQKIVTTAAGATSYPDSGLTPNTLYTYRVRAVNAGGPSGYTNNAPGQTLPPVPAAPTELRAPLVSQTSVRLEWNDNSANETGFLLMRRLGSGAFSPIASLGENVTAYVDGGVGPGGSYVYRVVAFNRGGNSAPSNDLPVTTPPDPPSVPRNLAIAGVTLTTVSLVWTDSSFDETSFRVERRLGSGQFEEIGSVGADVTTYTDTGLQPGTACIYRVRARNSGGDSAPSNEAATSTRTDPPAAADSLIATPLSATEIRIDWRDNSGNETGFQLERRTGNQGFTRIASPAANATSYTDGNLTPDTVYTYQVRAVKGDEASAYSNEASAATLPLPPNAPTGLAVEVISSTSLRLTWIDNSSSETGFEIERRTTGDFSRATTVGASVSTFLDAELSPSTTYTYRVRAIGPGGPSTYSNEASGATSAPSAAVAGLTVSPTSVRGGKTAAGTVTLSAPAGAGGVRVTLSSNNSKVLVPPAVTVPESATTTTFKVRTMTVKKPTAATLTAEAGASSAQASLTVKRR